MQGEAGHMRADQSHTLARSAQEGVYVQTSLLNDAQGDGLILRRLHAEPHQGWGLDPVINRHLEPVGKLVPRRSARQKAAVPREERLSGDRISVVNVLLQYGGERSELLITPLGNTIQSIREATVNHGLPVHRAALVVEGVQRRERFLRRPCI